MISFAKKFLSIALALVLLVGVFPVAANAAGEQIKLHYFQQDGTATPDWTTTHTAPYTLVAPANLPVPYWPVAEGQRACWLKADSTGKPVVVDGHNVEITADTVVNEDLYLRAGSVPVVEEGGQQSEDHAEPTVGTVTFRAVKVEKGATTELGKMELEVPLPGSGAKINVSVQSWLLSLVPGSELSDWTYPETGKPVSQELDRVFAIDQIHTLKYIVPEVAEETEKSYVIHYYDRNGKEIPEWAFTVNKSVGMADDGSYTLRKTNVPYIQPKAGEQFDGWYRYYLEDGTIGSEYAAGRVINGEINLIQQFSEIVKEDPNAGVMKYRVRFLEKIEKEVDKDVLLVKYSREIADGQIMAEMFPELKEKALPELSRQNYIFTGWALSDANGNVINPSNPSYYKWNTVFNEGRSIDLVATWSKQANVFLHIFVNGDVNHEYEVHLIENCKVGDSIDVSKIDVLDHYKNGNGRKTADKVFGIYDLAGWRDYKLDGKAKPLSGFMTVEGNTNSSNLYAMVYDASIKNNSKPDKTNPKTGDDSMIYAATAVMLISAGALAVFAMDRKRRKV